jgi:hypothetical protein
MRARQSTLSSLCAWLVKRSVLSVNPVSQLDRPPHSREAPKQVPGPAIMDALIHAAKERRRPLHYTVDSYPVRIVALDTTVPGKHHGEVDDPAVAWLAKKLEEDPERPTLLLMHHHPFPCGIPYLDI